VGRLLEVLNALLVGVEVMLVEPFPTPVSIPRCVCVCVRGCMCV
jgi:hypothetical protein